ncbi:unnamed protein product [Arabis nemorensis]|uniref:Uncharacterized protein n=1 Tax=Arabis nemorensis TaxID=586526 RepID=A0A565BI90_9BRAS|nr:unnamed protein product [Arabis nemorensis]
MMFTVKDSHSDMEMKQPMKERFMTVEERIDSKFALLLDEKEVGAIGVSVGTDSIHVQESIPEETYTIPEEESTDSTTSVLMTCVIFKTRASTFNMWKKELLMPSKLHTMYSVKCINEYKIRGSNKSFLKPGRSSLKTDLRQERHSSAESDGINHCCKSRKHLSEKEDCTQDQLVRCGSMYKELQNIFDPVRSSLIAKLLQISCVDHQVCDILLHSGKTSKQIFEFKFKGTAESKHRKLTISLGQTKKHITSTDVKQHKVGFTQNVELHTILLGRDAFRVEIDNFSWKFEHDYSLATRLLELIMKEDICVVHQSQHTGYECGKIANERLNVVFTICLEMCRPKNEEDYITVKKWMSHVSRGLTQFMIADVPFRVKHKWPFKLLKTIADLALCVDSAMITFSYAISGYSERTQYRDTTESFRCCCFQPGLTSLHMGTQVGIVFNNKKNKCCCSKTELFSCIVWGKWSIYSLSICN